MLRARVTARQHRIPPLYLRSEGCKLSSSVHVYEPFAIDASSACTTIAVSVDATAPSTIITPLYGEDMKIPVAIIKPVTGLLQKTTWPGVVRTNMARSSAFTE